ncbi:hypothetical protein PRZ48_013976 [Zasmidium cellare]|uniref:Heme haloperoxidase family profile domain-containing protein n=1 Tax=Zasmidium cellare TaxID=395010 RepID=A0ABR0E030_ZASCE|nr:hypothetical protein PRZ48_013976 [Zasmidium cellare]
MKFLALFAGVAVAQAVTAPTSSEDASAYSYWQPGGPGDFRGPCPMMNTLANHYFLPHDGKNLTREVVTKALQDALNFEPSLTEIMFEQALPANPIPNATWFDLDLLNVHAVLEHDASLSRSDAYFGNNHVFNQTIFDESKKYWTDDLVTANQLTNSKVARQLQSRATNPTYNFSSTVDSFSKGEVLAPIVAFGDKVAATTNRTFMVHFFENEHLPIHLGWHRPTEPVTLEDVTKLSEILAKSQTLLTDSPSAQQGTQNTTHGETEEDTCGKRKMIRRAVGHFGVS